MNTKDSSPTSPPIIHQSRMLRKKAEEDLQHIVNRIQLLQVEERKSLSKLNLTKSRMIEISNIKKRNEDVYLERERYRHGNQQQVEESIQRTILSRDEQRRRIAQNKQYMLSQKRAAVMAVREKEQQLLSAYKVQADNDVNAKRIHAEEERKRQQLIRKRQDEMRSNIESSSKMEFEGRVQLEQQRLAHARAQVQQLVQEEKNLIQRLKRSQEQQQQAYEAMLASRSST